MTNSRQKEKEFLSIVMPVYNEEEVIETVIRDFCKNILSHFSKKEFIIVNDRSADKTPEILNKLAKEMDCLKIIHNEINQGHGISLRRAYDTSKGELIFHNDSDNQFKTADFWKLYEEMKKNNLDVVLGYRENRHDALHRLIITRILRLLGFLFFGVWIKDSNSPFKLHTRSALDRLLNVVPAHVFAPSLMMAMAAKKLNMKMSEISVEHLPRLTGKVSIVRWKLIKVCFKCASELFEFRKKINNVKNE